MLELQNNTRFEAQPLIVADESGVPVLTAVVKATFLIQTGGRLALPDEPAPVLFAGKECDDPDSSMRFEPETAFCKPTSDVVLLGSAQSATPCKVLDVGIRVGAMQKIGRVFGNRSWVLQGQSVVCTQPQPFTSMPLTYENAFGGWDRSAPDETQHQFEPRNPVGKGFGMPLGKETPRHPLPNIENPKDLVRSYGQVVEPVGFGFVSPHWQPRAALAGTYDDAWDKLRKPLLPTDFDRRFFNAASPGLVSPAYLKGNEAVVVVNASPEAKLSINLPGIPAPTVAVQLRGDQRHDLSTNLDTVIVDTDEMRLYLLWRQHVAIPDGPHSVSAVTVDCDHPAAKSRASRS